MTTGDAFPVHCPRCNQIVASREVHEQLQRLDEHGGEIHVTLLFACPDCPQTFLVEKEGVFVGDSVLGGYVWEKIEFLYPAPRALGAGVPANIAASYTEGDQCFQINAYTAATIMCRRTLEGICAHHKCVGRTLAAKLQNLKEQGIIENRLYEWAKSLKDTGNDAAHDVSVSIAREDAQDVLEFTHALTEYIFTFADAFEKFKERRTKRLEKKGNGVDTSSEEPK